MNQQALELILSQNLSTTKEFVKMMFDSLKSEIQELRNENCEIKKSLEFTQDQLARANKQLEDQVKCTGKVSQVSSDITGISDRVRKLEDHARRKNIIIDGMEESSVETEEILQVNVQKMFKERMEVQPEIAGLYRLGTKNNNGRPRGIMVQLKNEYDRRQCLRAAARLKGTNIYLNEDVSKTTQEIRKTKMQELKDKRQQGYVAYFSGVDIIVRQRSEPATAGGRGMRSATRQSAAQRASQQTTSAGGNRKSREQHKK